MLDVSVNVMRPPGDVQADLYLLVDWLPITFGRFPFTTGLKRLSVRFFGRELNGRIERWRKCLLER